MIKNSTTITFEAYQGDEPFVFVSYAHTDKELVFNDLKRLKSNGYLIWYDEGILPAKNWSDEIAAAIDKCQCVIVFLSDAALNSQYVRKVIDFAIITKKPILPVYIKDIILPSGLNLQIGNIQAILRWQLSNQQYLSKINKALNHLKIFDRLKNTKEQIGKNSTSERSIRPSDNKINIIANNFFKRMNRNQLGIPLQEGILSGFMHIDHSLGGFQNGRTYLFAGGKAIGKTTFTVNLICNMVIASKESSKIALFLIGESGGRFFERIISCCRQIFLVKINRGMIDNSELDSIQKDIINKMFLSGFFIDDDLTTYAEIEDKCYSLIKESKFDAIFIDDLSLLTKLKKNNNKETLDIMKGLKKMAQNFNIPLILMLRIQYNFGKNGRAPDLKDIGIYGQEADVVILLDRPEYYKSSSEENDDLRRLIYLDIAKNRTGNCDKSIRLKIDSNFQKIDSYWRTYTEMTMVDKNAPPSF